jgi:hypothetical protein
MNIPAVSFLIEGSLVQGFPFLASVPWGKCKKFWTGSTS